MNRRERLLVGERQRGGPLPLDEAVDVGAEAA